MSCPLARSRNMTASNVGFQEVAELASHLSPEEQIAIGGVDWSGT